MSYQAFTIYYDLLHFTVLDILQYYKTILLYGGEIDITLTTFLKFPESTTKSNNNQMHYLCSDNILRNKLNKI